MEIFPSPSGFARRPWIALVPFLILGSGCGGRIQEEPTAKDAGTRTGRRPDGGVMTPGFPWNEPESETTPLLACSAAPWNAPATSCSGEVLASGSMEDSDDPEIAAASCERAGIPGTCCMFQLYGVGRWYLTDGEPVSGTRECEKTRTGSNDCASGGVCVRR
ncbi:MAG: hypothetical protein U0169_01985 [Polyangiaceae bacterium]